MSNRKSRGFMLADETDRMLDAVAVVTGKSKSDVVAEGICRQRESLPDAARRAVDAVVAAARSAK